MIFRLTGMSADGGACVQIIDDGGVTVYFALLEDFQTDINDGEFTFGLPFGVAGFRYDTRAGAEPLRVFTDALGRDFPFPSNGHWPLIDSLLDRADELMQRGNARNVIASTITQKTIDDLALSFESINPATAIQVGRMKVIQPAAVAILPGNKPL